MFRQILVVLDTSPAGGRELAWVRRLARPAGATVRLLAVCAPAQAVTVRGRTVAWADQVEASDRAAAQVALRLAGARLEADGVPIEQDVRVGDPVAAILAAAREGGADLIVLAARGADRLVDRLRARRATTGVLRRAPVPVLLTRRGGQRVA